MKYINKGAEPQDFTKWKRKNPKSNFKSFSDGSVKDSIQIKQSVNIALLEEQGYICCYCERPLKDGDYHIEHLIPQSKASNRSLDFSNMLCSCQGKLKSGQKLHCGKSKDKWYQESVFVSPLDSSCESRFKYTKNGLIKPCNENDIAAITTIEKLQLDIDKLNAQRNSTIDPFIYFLNDDEVSDVDFRTFVDGYLREKEDNNGKYNAFYTTIKSLFGRVL